MVHISVFIRPQTNRIQGHQIINSSEFPPTPLKCTPLIFHPFRQKQHPRSKVIIVHIKYNSMQQEWDEFTRRPKQDHRDK